MFLRSARHMAIPGISTNDRERFPVRADEKLTAFVELESAVRLCTKKEKDTLKFHEVDWRIHSLEHVVVGIDVGLADIEARIGDPEWYDGVHACGNAEPLLGLGFVAFQTYAVRARADLNRIRGQSRQARKEQARLLFLRSSYFEGRRETDSACPRCCQLF
jgi:hypothetical protein